MRSLALAAVVVLVVAGAAHADEAADKKKAKSHYKLGLEYQKEGQYLQAAEEYKAAYALTPKPELLYNVARAYQLGGDRKNAADYYQKFLDQVPEGEAADEARQFLAQMAREADEEQRARQEEARKQREADEAEAKRKQQEQDAADAEARRQQAERDRQAAAATPPEAHQVPDRPGVSEPEPIVETPAAPPSRFHRLRLGVIGGIGMTQMSKVPDVIGTDNNGNIGGFAAQVTADVQLWVTPWFVVRFDAGLEFREARFEHCIPCMPTGELQYKGAAFAVLPGIVLDPDGGASVMIYAGLSGSYLSGDFSRPTAIPGMTSEPMPLGTSTTMDAVGGVALRIRIGDKHYLLEPRGSLGLKDVLGDASVKSILLLVGSTWGL